MKHFFTFLLTILFITAFSQNIPGKFYYQGVVLDASGTPVANQTIGVQVTIHQGSASGTTVYQETQQPVTDANGRFSMFIGDGVSSGSLSDIDWASGPFYCNIAIDPSGGSSYNDYGTFQLVSVPYAYLAQKAVKTINDSVIDDDADPANELQDLSSVLSRGNDAGNMTITGLADPTNATEAATKNYVDDRAEKTFTLNRYYVSAFVTSSDYFTISNQGDTVVFGYEELDVGSVYDNTKGLYYVPTFGYYLVTVSLGISSSASSTVSLTVGIFPTSSNYNLTIDNTGGAYKTFTFTTMARLTQGSKIYVQIQDNDNSNNCEIKSGTLRIIRM